MSWRRRKFLAALGLGGAGALVSAGAASLLPSRAGANPGAAPKRLIVLHTMHGAVYQNWRMRPGGEPDDVDFNTDVAGLDVAQFSSSLAPLHRHREDLLVLDGLSLVSAYCDVDAADNHRQGQLTCLTGSNNDRSAGQPASRFASLDQRVAREISPVDRLASLELGMATSEGLVSYHAPLSPLPVERDPGRVWDRIFGLSQGTGSGSELYGAQGGVLAALDADYRALAGRLSAEDKLKLEQHAQMIRELELRIAGMRQLACAPYPHPGPQLEEMDYETHHALMLDLLVQGMACGATCVATMVHGTLPGELVGVPGRDVHAEFAHDSRSNPASIDVMTSYYRVHAEHMAQVMDALAAVPEGEGTMLDNTLVLMLGELGNGEHGYETWPVVIGGGAAVTGWNMGRYMRMAPSTHAPGADWQSSGAHEPSWPNDLAGVPHQKLLTTVAAAFGVKGDDGELVTSSGETRCTAADGVEIDLRGTLSQLS